MENVRFGVVGLGNMGSAHAKNIIENNIKGAVLTAVCDILPDRLESFENVKKFTDYKKMLSSGVVDAVIVATPHYLHPEIAVCAFENNVNVLSEKPSGVYTKQIKKMNEAAKIAGKAFSIMFNQRTTPIYKKARELFLSGVIGEPKRFVWLITNWYRTQKYYDSGDWRGSYKGEGGGVLMNQAPHNLDIWQWIFGMPKSISANIYCGKYHNISVEDEAEIFAEYENGATAVFITSTGEYPGTNRLEISGDKGKMVLENNKIMLYTANICERDFCFSSNEEYAIPEISKQTFEFKDEVHGHTAILQNFTNNILFGEPLIVDGLDGINEAQLCNASYMSAWTNKRIDLPIDDEEFYSILQEQIEKESCKKTVKKTNNPSGEYSERWNVKW